MALKKPHPFDNISIRGDNVAEARILLRKLPADTFGDERHVMRYVRGSVIGGGETGDYGIYARLSDLVGAQKGLMLVIIDPHLGDNLDIGNGPDALLKVPDRAKNISFYPGRTPPSRAGFFAGVEFRYKGSDYAFLYERSEAQAKLDKENVRSIQKG